jgi:uncharacterized protein (DUF486 family)
MASGLSDEEVLKLAKQRVEAKKGFFVHLSMYIVVNVFLVLIWWLVTGGRNAYPWFLWVLFGWGIGVAANAVAVFVTPRGSSWEQKELQKEIERLKKL